MKVLQINLGRSVTAHDIMIATAMELKIDIIIISEPNKNSISKKGPWICDKKQDAAIQITNPRLRIGRRKKRKGYAWANVGGIRIISCYISPNGTTEEFEMYLTKIERDLKSTNKQVIIAGDFNAKSPEWGSNKVDRRGEILSEWLAANKLVVQNKGNAPTFIRNEQQSIIDVTLSTENVD